MKAFLLVAAIAAMIAALAGAFLHQAFGGAGEAESPRFELIGNRTVTKVIDGDTVVSEGESIRLLGIDADERGYPCYQTAKLRLEELVLGKQVYLEADARDRDQYGRYLRYIFVDGQNINLQMVREGLVVARFYPENVKYKAEIIAAEAEARKARAGCKWNQTAAQPGEAD